jgi:peptidoglycan/xylan/chitin deacetylase (PgdA/CDA1 family)
VFRQHLDALSDLGRIVPLERLLDPTSSDERVRFAITFDDDHAGYVESVLPVLHASRAPATFFLSGRSLHGLEPYWWTSLENSIRVLGFEETRARLGLSGGTPADLAIALEGSARVLTLARQLPASNDGPMPTAHIRALANAGMTIGFHTLHHPVLDSLAGSALRSALTEGRTELSNAAGTRIDLLAYPHGRANSSVAAMAEQVGFAAAYIADGHPITSLSDRFLLSRWEPGPLSSEEFRASVVLRLLRPPSPKHRRPTQPH